MRPKVDSRVVVLGVSIGLVVAGLPLLNKTVYEREQQVASLRDASYEAKDTARDARLRVRDAK